MISEWTIITTLYRFGPMSMEALATYLSSARVFSVPGIRYVPEAIAIKINELLGQGRTVLMTHYHGRHVESLWIALPHTEACREPMSAFDHVTVWQANQLNAMRLNGHPDTALATHKIAQRLGCRREQIDGFLRRNPRPELEAA